MSKFSFIQKRAKPLDNYVDPKKSQEQIDKLKVYNFEDVSTDSNQSTTHRTYRWNRKYCTTVTNVTVRSSTGVNSVQAHDANATGKIVQLAEPLKEGLEITISKINTNFKQTIMTRSRSAQQQTLNQTISRKRKQAPKCGINNFNKTSEKKARCSQPAADKQQQTTHRVTMCQRKHRKRKPAIKPRKNKPIATTTHTVTRPNNEPSHAVATTSTVQLEEPIINEAITDEDNNSRSNSLFDNIIDGVQFIKEEDYEQPLFLNVFREIDRWNDEEINRNMDFFDNREAND